MSAMARLPKLHLDYQAAPARGRALGVAALALSLGATVVVLERYRDIRLEIERVEAARGLLAPARVTAPSPRLEQDLKAADAVLAQLALPWASIVNAVESAAKPDVALLQMQPDARARQVRLGAEARTEKAMLAYLRRLGESGALAEVHLVSHQVVVEDPQRPIHFTVLARLKDPA